jgi:quercetin dioxygenase-like cupin family protein
MERRFDTRSIREGGEDKPRKVNLFETARCFADVHVLRPGQASKVHTHAAEDKCYHVLSGEGVVTVGTEEIGVREGHLVFCPAGEPHGVRNDGDGDLRLLVFMAPHPRTASS